MLIYTTLTRLELVKADTVNRICGWGLWKLKQKYKKLINKDCVNLIYEMKYHMLDDITFTVYDSMNNVVYI